MTFAKAFEEQARACAKLGSPFTAHLLELAAGLRRGTPVADRLLNWPGDMRGSGDSVPLRLAGALHALVLNGRAPDLAAHYPPNAPGSGLWHAVTDALQNHEDFVMRWLDSAPQTNEVARAAALILAGALLHDRFGVPFHLSELGASAGLNLRWDQFRLDLPGHRLGPEDADVVLSPDWTGPIPPPPPTPDDRPKIAERRGVDLAPVDPNDPDDALRLRSYIWPDQFERHERLSAAFKVAARVPAQADRADAIDWLAERLAIPRHDALHLIYHTVAWQYFPKQAQARGAELIAAAGARATPQAPIAWLGMEADERTPGAGLRLRIWPGDQTIDLARIDFHGRWITWKTPTL